MEITKDLALFYGIMMGDGCISRCRRGRYVVVTCNVHDDSPFFDGVVIPLLTKIRGKEVKYRVRPDQGKIEVNFSDKLLFNTMVSLGFPIGLKGNIQIPEVFSRKLWKHIVAGMFATDGSLVLANNNGTVYPRVEICTVSSGFAHQIRDFLSDNQIKGNLYKREGKGNRKASFRLEVPGKPNLLKFRDKIGFVNPKHESKFQRYLEVRSAF